MAAISQTIFSYAFSRLKILVFSLQFPIQGSNWQQYTFGFDIGLVPKRRQAIIWTNADSIHCRIYAALGGDELRRDKILMQLKVAAISFNKNGG